MSAQLPPVDWEDLVVEFLNQAPEVLALHAAPAAWTDLPREWAPDPDGDPAALRISKVPSAPLADARGHVDRARIQIDSFGATPKDAFDLCRAALVAVLRLDVDPWRYPGAVVNTVGETIRLQRRDDPKVQLPRYFTEVVLTGHPVSV